MNPDQVLRPLRRSNDVALRAASMGHHPFGALLVAPDGETVLAESVRKKLLPCSMAITPLPANPHYARSKGPPVPVCSNSP